MTPAETRRIRYIQFDAIKRSGKEHGMDNPFAEAMIGDLAAVGIKAKLVIMKYSALRENALAGKAQMQFLNWESYSINDVPAITSHFFKFEADDLAVDKKVKDLLIEADTSIDTPKQKELYSKALISAGEDGKLSSSWGPRKPFPWLS